MATGEVIGFSAALGLALTIITLFIGYLSTNTGFQKYIWLTLPIISYGIAIAILSGANAASCGAVSIGIVLRAALFTVVSVIGFLGISNFEFFQNFVVGVLPPSLQSSLGGTIATAFYMFWAGLFGGAIGVGFTQSCPATK